MFFQGVGVPDHPPLYNLGDSHSTLSMDSGAGTATYILHSFLCLVQP